jgi:hypothetical protein
MKALAYLVIATFFSTIALVSVRKSMFHKDSLPRQCLPHHCSAGRNNAAGTRFAAKALIGLLRLSNTPNRNLSRHLIYYGGIKPVTDKQPLEINRNVQIAPC